VGEQVILIVQPIVADRPFLDIPCPFWKHIAQRGKQPGRVATVADAPPKLPVELLSSSQWARSIHFLQIAVESLFPSIRSQLPDSILAHPSLLYLLHARKRHLALFDNHPHARASLSTFPRKCLSDEETPGDPPDEPRLSIALRATLEHDGIVQNGRIVFTSRLSICDAEGEDIEGRGFNHTDNAPLPPRANEFPGTIIAEEVGDPPRSVEQLHGDICHPRPLLSEVTQIAQTAS